MTRRLDMRTAEAAIGRRGNLAHVFASRFG
jgi:hypothetical protein